MNSVDPNQFLWPEKYRPTKVRETLLPERLKKTFQAYVNNKQVPNLLLHGSSGVGKTTIARAMLDELGISYLMINGSKDGDIDTLRSTIAPYASSLSLTGGRRYVIIDEGDNMTHKMQTSFRAFIEEFSSNCGFIITCNYPQKIMPAILSRFTEHEFKLTKPERLEIARAFYKSVCGILKVELIEYDPKVVAQVIKDTRLDMRKALNQLQGYAATGKIDSGVLVQFDDMVFRQLIQLLKDKNFDGIRKWVIDNEQDDQTVFRRLYDQITTYCKNKEVQPLIAVTLNEYQYKAAFVMDKEINLVACLVELAAEVPFE